MSHGLPDDWYEEHDGQRLVLDSEKVSAEINRLREALEEIISLSDLEMADGDGARKIASRVLGAGQ